MKAATTDLNNLLLTGDFVYADLYEITLAGGSVVRYTSADIPLSWAGNTYASGPLVERNNISTKRGVEVNTLELDITGDDNDLINGVPIVQFISNRGLDGANVNMKRAYMAGWSPLSYMFNFGQLPVGVTDAGASLGTLVDNTGLITYGPNNQIAYSQDFTQWGQDGAVITPAAGTAPDGTHTATTVGVGTGNNRIYLYDNSGILTQKIFSIYVKSNTGSSVAIGDINLGQIGTINTDTGAISSGGAGAAAVNVGNGWWRVSVPYNCTVASGNSAYFVISCAAGNVLIWGAQNESVTYEVLPRTHNPTTGAVFYGARFDYDPNNVGVSFGVLDEPAATNLALKSQKIADATWVAFLTASKIGVAPVAAPDGTLSAYEVNPGTTGGSSARSGIYQTNTSAAGTYTWTGYVRAKTGTTTVALCVTSAGVDHYSADLAVSDTGWTRLSLTVTVGAALQNISLRGNNAGNSANVYAWGFQLQTGPVASTYLPTDAASATRSADALTLNWAPVLPSGTLSVTYQFDDGTVQTVSTTVTAGLAAMPTNLNRVRVKSASAQPAIVGVLDKYFYGRVTSVSDISGAKASVTASAWTVLFNVNVPPNLYQAGCLHTVYDSGCNLNPASFQSTGTVASGGTKTQITFPSNLSTNGYYDQGRITFTSGPNSGTTSAVKHNDGSGIFSLISPLPFAPATGNTFTAVPGCDLTQATCLSKFNNLGRFKATPYVPVPETAV